MESLSMESTTAASPDLASRLKDGPDEVTVTVNGALGAGISDQVGGGVVVTSVEAGGAAEAAGVQLMMHVVAFNGDSTLSTMVSTTSMMKNEVMALVRASHGPKTWVFAADAPARPSSSDGDGDKSAFHL